MVNLDMLLSKRGKGSGNPNTPPAGQHPTAPPASQHPTALPASQHPTALPAGRHSTAPRLKDKITSGGAEEASRSKGKELALQTKRPRPTTADDQLEKGKSVTPHLTDVDSAKDLWRFPGVGVKMSRRAIRDVDLACVKPRSSRALANSAHSDIARLPVVLETLANRAEDFEKKCDSLTEELSRLTKENSQLQLDKDSATQQLDGMRRELDEMRREWQAEKNHGHGYLSSTDGQHFIKSLEEAAVLKYKDSPAYAAEYLSSAVGMQHIKSCKDAAVVEYKTSQDFEEYLAESSIPVFDQCLEFCRKRLVDSGRFPGESFEFLDPAWVETADIPPPGPSGVDCTFSEPNLLQILEGDDDLNIDIDDLDVDC